jgi:predicted nucleic acid-binding Zn finger protein
VNVSRVGPSQYRVESGREVYWVDLMGDEQCHCADHLFRSVKRGSPCKHLRAVYDFEKGVTDGVPS